MKQRVNSLGNFQQGFKDYISGGHHASCASGIIHTLFIFLLIGLLPVTTAWSFEGRGYLEVNSGYKTGDFGTSTRSNLYYFSPAMGFASPRYDVNVTIPFLFLSDRDKTAGQTYTEKGIGDIILRGGMVVVPETKFGFSLTSSLAVKLPNADEIKGLGTGKTNYGGFIGVQQRLIGQNHLMLSTGYIVVGDAQGVDFNNIYIYDIGYKRIFTRSELSVWYEGRRSAIPDTKNSQEINAGVLHILNRNYSIKGSSFAGLNNGGPDFGVNLQIVRWF